VTLVRLEQGPEAAAAWVVLPAPLETLVESLSNPAADEYHAAAASAADAESSRVPLLGSLLAGPSGIDLPGLERAADEFFSRLKGLAGGVAASPVVHRLTPWLVAAAAFGVIEFARRRARPAGPCGPACGDGEAPNWAPSPVLAVLPPEEES
jgi:hypothetical protein